MTNLSGSESAALAIIPKFSSVFSFFGSLWIIIEVCTEKTKLGVPYHRLLLAMSVYDAVESIFNFLSTWPIPKDTEGVIWASGNTASCTAQGFFLQLSIAIPLYNAMLSYYYVLVIKYNYTDRRLRSCVEPSMHIFCFVWAFGTALYSAVAELMNNADLWCWIASFPHDCIESWSVPEGEINDNPCTRGDNIWVYRFGFYFIPLWTSIFVGTVCTYIVYKYVYAQDMKTLRYRRPDRRVGMWGMVKSISKRFSGRTLDAAAADKDKEGEESHPSTKDTPENNPTSDSKTLDKSPLVEHRTASTATGLGSVPEDSQPNFQQSERSSIDYKDRSNRLSLLLDNTPDNLSRSLKEHSEGREPTGPWSVRSTNNNNSVRSVTTVDSADVLAIQDEFAFRAAKMEMEAASERRDVSNDDMDCRVRPTIRQRFQAWKARREQYARDMPHTVEVFHQALFYCGAFYCTHIWSTTNRILQAIGGDDASSFFLLVMHSFFDPFQGFLNFLVYQRPRYIQMRKKYPDLSFMQIWRIVLRFTYMGEYVIPKRKEKPQGEPGS